MFQKLVHEWKEKMKPTEVAAKVKVCERCLFRMLIGWKPW